MVSHLALYVLYRQWVQRPCRLRYDVNALETYWMMVTVYKSHRKNRKGATEPL